MHTGTFAPHALLIYTIHLSPNIACRFTHPILELPKSKANSSAVLFMTMAWWGVRVGPLGFGGSIKGPGFPSLGTVAAIVVVAWLLELVLGFLTLLKTWYFFIFTLNGRDETYFVLIFLLVFYLMCLIGSSWTNIKLSGNRFRGAIVLLSSASSAGIFATFWKQVPLVNPDLARLSNAAAAKFFGNTLIAFAPIGLWLAAIGSSLACFMSIIFLMSGPLTKSLRKLRK
jgi:hypothetical protein